MFNTVDTFFYVISTFHVRRQLSAVSKRPQTEREHKIFGHLLIETSTPLQDHKPKHIAIHQLSWLLKPPHIRPKVKQDMSLATRFDLASRPPDRSLLRATACVLCDSYCLSTTGVYTLVLHILA